MQTNLKLRAMSRVNIIAMEGVMGQIDRSPTDYIMPPRKLAERLTAVANSEAAEEPTASLMAQRFAPEAAANDTSAVAEAPEPEPLRARARSAAEFQPERVRLTAPAVVAGLIVTTILCGVAVSVAAWKSGMTLPVSLSFTHGDGAQMEASTTSHPLETVLRKQDVLIPRVALTAPVSLDATAGSDVQFALTLDSAEPLPSRSTLVISGLAEGMKFSAGRPFGQTEWSLTPSEISELNLTVPANVSGQHDLGITLLTADGTELARAATHLLVGASATDSLVTRPDAKGRIDELISHGRKMIEVGYLAGARAYYRRAAEAGSGEASFALAATYDPALIQQMGAQGIKPDIGEARTWYERARSLGVKEAGAELERLDSLPATAPQAQAGVVLPPTQPASAQEGNPDWVEMSGSANLRESPSANSPALKVVQRGTRVLAVGRQGGWVHITDPATKDDGWVYSRYLATKE